MKSTSHEPEKPDITIIADDPAEYRARRKVIVNGVEVNIIKERVQYMGDDGKIITESLRDYTRKNIRTVLRYARFVSHVMDAN